MTLQFDDLLVCTGGFSLNLAARLAGPITGVFGPSGAGKTTLLEAVAGLVRVKRGRIVMNGETLTDAEGGIAVAPEDRGIGYVPQDGALFPHLSVEQNIRFGAKPHAPPSGLFDVKHICELMAISGLMQRRPHELSGGERQRVCFARALVSQPKMLVLDEPMAGLDPSRKAAILPYLLRIKDEFRLPMLYVSHSPDEIVAICDDVLVLEEGRLRQSGPTHALFARSDAPTYRLK